ncbi:MAG: N-acetylneuraminate synthase family protein [Candidatus Omnitrophica bacterium]|jgi:N-acetylneuraminate synthase/N,N'-diacetyllegionaminate synthase|nr:N-acetylneuraminate synthase family protein [Candidatus Omnitrophota bacterium]
MKTDYDLRQGKKVYIISEAGINHNGSLHTACDMVRTSADSGADAVKFQNYDTKDFIVDRSITYTYKERGRKKTQSMWQLCRRCQMGKGWIEKLKKLCDCLGIDFLSTPTSKKGVDELIRAGVKMLKNGSDYLSHLPLLRYMSGFRLPIILSTGMAYEQDIREAVEAASASGKTRVILLHCTSNYPAKADDVNLARMAALRQKFNLPVGFSDHTVGNAAAVQSVALGASIIEKHFTLDRNMSGPDHWFSMTPSGLKAYVKDIREAEKRMGSALICPAKNEMACRQEFTLSLVAARRMKKGRRLGVKDILIAKPGTGIKPKDIDNVKGLALKVDIAKGAPITWQDLAR